MCPSPTSCLGICISSTSASCHVRFRCSFRDRLMCPVRSDMHISACYLVDTRRLSVLATWETMLVFDGCLTRSSEARKCDTGDSVCSQHNKPRSANARRWPNVGLMLGQRCRRWANVSPTLGKQFVFAGHMQKQGAQASTLAWYVDWYTISVYDVLMLALSWAQLLSNMSNNRTLVVQLFRTIWKANWFVLSRKVQ